MPDQEKLEYSQLETGYEFPPSTFDLDPALIAEYIQAVEETSSLYQDALLVPPSAIAAYAQAALAAKIALLPGTIHVSQELEFMGSVNAWDTLTSRARVTRKQERAKMRILNIELAVFDRNARLVMKGKTSFILPMSDGVS